MLDTLPQTYEDVKDWTWEELEPLYAELQNRTLTADNIDAWLRDWTALDNLVSEIFSRARVATTQDTSDEHAESIYKNLLATLYPRLEEAQNNLNTRLLESQLTPENMELPLKRMRTDVDLYRDENIPLKQREQVLGLEFNKLVGPLTVQWEGEELTLPQVSKLQREQDRDVRERAWRASMNAYLSVRQPANEIWQKLFEVRTQLATNTGFDNYRDYIWLARHRFDYTPEDCITFHNAIEQVVVPAARKRNEVRRKKLGLDKLRPWDLGVDPEGRPPINVWDTIDDFATKAETIFNSVDSQLGEYYLSLRKGDLLDLPNRKNKGVGAYCTQFPMTQTPFVFMNAVNLRDDVRTLLHEVGHAFHGFETYNLPYSHQREYPIEFAEVASMAMELLAAPYLTQERGGYFTREDAARDRIEHLEKILFFWPYMSVVDAFQHWAYTSGNTAADSANCDAKWAELWDRFMVAADYTGLQDVKETGWHRKHHIFRYPFYYVEYGLAQLGAVQVWANALKDQAGAVRSYRSGLALGGTKNLYELFGASGAKFAFDAETLGEAVNLITRTIEELEGELA
jgi:oligoendopeptidase F